jgi:hypothetical protein
MLKETFHEGEQLGVLLGAIKLSGVCIESYFKLKF